MAVFTTVSQSEFSGWARRQYALSRISQLLPVHEGIENTNYRVNADGKEYIFTIFELWDSEAVAYYTAFMQHLNKAGLPVPAAVTGSDGAQFFSWQGKPCALVPFIDGGAVTMPDEAQCAAVGDLLAQMHIAAAGFPHHRQNPRNHAWRLNAAAAVREQMPDELQQLLDTALADDAHFNQAPLPGAACHCDLFRNNVLWHRGAVNAVIDFYFGGYDALIFDLAVCACDWCYRDHAFHPALLSELISGYNRRRRLGDLEKELFADALNSAATRFWLSRHYDILYPRRAQTLAPHNPLYFEDILRTIHRGKRSLIQLMREAA